MNENSLALPRLIAIDGPAASGKSVLAQQLAARLGYFYFDTGLMYRAVTNEAIARQIPLDDQTALTHLAESIEINVLPYAEHAQHSAVTVNGCDVSPLLHRPQVDRNVSLVSSYAGVRQAMVEQQRRIAERGKMIMAGRDIGTVVLPDAECKIYLTASVDARARRRKADRLEREHDVSYENMRDEILQRDEMDSSRSVSPLRIADDAFILDNSNLTIDETVERAVAIAHTCAKKLVVHK